MLQFCIVQLAFQAQCLPEYLVDFGKGRDSAFVNFIRDQTTVERLTSLLISILPKFQRTYILLDGLDEIRTRSTVPSNQFHYLQDQAASTARLFEILESLLEQNLGNVSVATFSRPLPTHFDTILALADVSIRLLRVEYQSADIARYVNLKVGKLIKPELRVVMESTLSNDQKMPLESVRSNDLFWSTMNEVVSSKCRLIVDAVVIGSDDLYDTSRLNMKPQLTREPDTLPPTCS